MQLLTQAPRAGNQKFILKTLFAEDIKGCFHMYRSLRSSPYLRLSEDVIPEQSTLVYPYFTDHLLNLAQKDLPLPLTKRILKDALRGLAALHDQNIVHTGRQDDFWTRPSPPY
jgi:serine/threonine protein kinase